MIERAKLCFIQNSQNKNEYFLKVSSIEYARDEYVNKLNHRNGYEESGYPYIPCEFVMAIDIPDEVYERKEKWAEFIVSTYGIQKHQEPFLKGMGWYEFSEIKYSNKWIEDFNSYQIQRRKEFLKATNQPVQTKLF